MTYNTKKGDIACGSPQTPRGGAPNRLNTSVDHSRGCRKGAYPQIGPCLPGYKFTSASDVHHAFKISLDSNVGMRDSSA